MEQIIKLLSNPLVWKILFSYWLYSAFVGALPAPKATSSEFYQFVFRFVHIFSGNLNRAAMEFKVPGAQNEIPPA